MSAPLTDDQISKRIFYAGLFGLPWLQLVHSMGFYSNKRNNLISAESEIAENQEVWVRRSRCCAIFVTMVWLTWILVVQFIFPEKLPSSLFVRVPDQGEYTGW